MAALHISQEGRAADTLGAAFRRPLPQFHTGSRRRFRRHVEFRDRTESEIESAAVPGEYRPLRCLKFSVGTQAENLKGGGI